MNDKSNSKSRSRPCLRALSTTVLLCALAASGFSARGQFVFDTASAWNSEDGILGSLGPGTSSTIGETIIAPDAAEVTLNSFTFYGQSHPEGGYANLDLEAFVYAWSGNVTGTGGGAVGSPAYLSPAFTYSPPPPSGNAFDGPWTPLTVTLGTQGVSLNPGQAYVIGVTLSDPACYAASSGAVEFQELSPPPGTLTGGGEAVWDNNSNDFAALNTSAWSTWGDTGDLSFIANFTVVPEPSINALAFVGALAWVVKSNFSRRKTCAVVR